MVHALSGLCIKQINARLISPFLHICLLEDDYRLTSNYFILAWGNSLLNELPTIRQSKGCQDSELHIACPE